MLDCVRMKFSTPLENDELLLASKFLSDSWDVYEVVDSFLVLCQKRVLLPLLYLYHSILKINIGDNRYAKNQLWLGKKVLFNKSIKKALPSTTAM